MDTALQDRSGFLDGVEGAVDTNETLHILLPSAHKYDLTNAIHIPRALLPLRIWGQTDHTGTPYCRARITGLDESDIIDVGSLPETDAQNPLDVTQLVFDLLIDALIHLMLYLVTKLLGLGVSFGTYAFMVVFALLREHAEIGDLLLGWSWRMIE